MVLHDTVGGAQAEAGAFADGLGGVERIEYPFRFADAGTGVGELDHGIGSMAERGDLERASADLGQRVHGVFHDLVKRLEQLIGISGDARQLGLERNRDLDAIRGMFGFQHLGATLQQRCQVHRDSFPVTLLGKAQQVRDEVAGTTGLIDDFANHSTLLGGEVFAGPELVGVKHYGGEGIVDFTGRACDQMSERSQFLFLHQMSLQPLLVVIRLARLLQKAHQCLVLDVLPQKHESAQHEHRSQHREQTKSSRRQRRLVEKESPQSQHGQRENGQHGELRRKDSPAPFPGRRFAGELLPARGERGCRHPGERGYHGNVQQTARVIGPCGKRMIQ